MPTIECKGCGKKIEVDFLSSYCTCSECGQEILTPSLVDATVTWGYTE